MNRVTISLANGKEIDLWDWANEVSRQATNEMDLGNIESAKEYIAMLMLCVEKIKTGQLQLVNKEILGDL